MLPKIFSVGLRFFFIYVSFNPLSFFKNATFVILANLSKTLTSFFLFHSISWSSYDINHAFGNSNQLLAWNSYSFLASSSWILLLIGLWRSHPIEWPNFLSVEFKSRSFYQKRINSWSKKKWKSFDISYKIKDLSFQVIGTRSIMDSILLLSLVCRPGLLLTIRSNLSISS